MNEHARVSPGFSSGWAYTHGVVLSAFIMNIYMLELIEGARKAKGLTVIIDVFRAFSTACYVFANGAGGIIPVGDLEVAYELKKQHPDFLLIGERGGKKLPGFDYGNSPAELEYIDFTNRTVIQTTSSGTQGIANASQAEEIITGSFCNAGAIIRYIQSRKPDQVSLVSMGQGGCKPSDEDTLCAQFIKDSLEGKTPDFRSIYTHLKNSRSAQRFFDPALPWSPERDFELCLNLARFDFVLRVQTPDKRLPSLQKIKDFTFPERTLLDKRRGF